jgi:hypothetical protein
MAEEIAVKHGKMTDIKLFLSLQQLLLSYHFNYPLHQLHYHHYHDY